MQMIPFSLPLLVLSCMISGASQMYAACVITDNPPSWKAYGWFAGLLTLHCIIALVTGLKDSPYLLPMTIILNMLPMYLSFGLKGWKLIQRFFMVYTLLILCELSLVPLLQIFNEEQVQAGRYFQTPVCLITQLYLAAVVYTFVHVYAYFRNLWSSKINLSVVGRFARVLLMIVVLSILYARADPAEVSVVGQRAVLERVNSEFFVIAILTGVSASYLYQDIQYTLLHRQNKALTQQQEQQDLLLHRSRMFHHNLANILCGLQGTIHSRDFSAIDHYCDAIVKRCQMINNENVQALRQIPRPAVSLLIQQKILDANEAEIPFYVHADNDLRYRGWKDDDMCQLLGVLLDNALEAAARSDAPYISMELHTLRRGMELVVRNTWGTEEKDPAPLVSTAPSRGLGLPSVKALLARYPRTTFSLYHRDRYVEAHLIFS